MNRDDSIRPSVLVLSAAFLLGSGYLVYRVFSLPDPSPAAPEAGGDARWIPEVEPEAQPGDTWRHRDWRPRPGDNAEVPPGPIAERDPSGPRPYSPHEELMALRETDPQMFVFRRTYRLIGDAGVPLPFSPTERRARLTNVEGTLPVPSSASCEVRVLPAQAGQYNCLVRVLCDGHVLYPNPDQSAGYAPCNVSGGRPTSALDEGNTQSDGDPLVRVDLEQGLVTVEDSGDGVSPFRATLRLGR